MATRPSNTQPAKKAPRGGPRLKIHDAEEASVSTAGMPSMPRRDRADDGDLQSRQGAFDTEFFWKDAAGTQVPLQAFGSGRESLWLQLRNAVGAPGLAFVMNDIDAFFADACRILFLCLHRPEEFRHLRGNPGEFQEAIEEWTDRAIPRGSNLRLDATLLALRIVNQSNVNRHEPAPAETTGSDSGN